MGNLRKFISSRVKSYLIESHSKDFLLNKILDKIHSNGLNNLSHDEKTYLKQLNDGNIDINLERWLLSDDEETFSYEDGHKLLYDEFESDEDLFYNYKKLIRVISKFFNKQPFSNSSDWGGSDVWSINSDDNFTGDFIVLMDDDLVLLNREIIDEDQYDDTVLYEINNVKDLNKVFSIIKNKS
jgi:hypothetical protein